MAMAGTTGVCSWPCLYQIDVRDLRVRWQGTGMMLTMGLSSRDSVDKLRWSILCVAVVSFAKCSRESASGRRGERGQSETKDPPLVC